MSQFTRFSGKFLGAAKYACVKDLTNIMSETALLNLSQGPLILTVTERSPKKSSVCACSTLESASWRRTSSWWSGWPTSTTTGWSTSRSLSGCWRWMSWRAWKGTRTLGFVELLNYQHPATGFPYNLELGWQNITSEHLCATCVQWTMTWWQTIEMPPS